MVYKISKVIKLIVITIFVAYAYQLYLKSQNTNIIHIDGEVDEKWKSVKDMFRKNLEENWERGGGAFVVYFKGRKVVDIWGGYSDKDSGRLWKKDTLSVAFSCSKAMGSLVIAKLVEEGKLKYKDLVIKYWPEFGKHGKENVTIEWLIGHKAGLAYTDHPIDIETAKNPNLIDKVFENQKPNWPPGKRIGYHAVTHGWLVDAIVRRVDGKKRSVGKYFKEEIADKYGVDFHIGLPISEQYRVARISNPNFWNIIEEIIYSPSETNIIRGIYDKITNGSMSKITLSTPFLQFIGSMTLNDPDLHRIEQSAVLGIGTARAMAEVFELIRNGKMLTPKVRDEAFSNYKTEKDVILGVTTPRGPGFMMKEYTLHKRKVNLYGHSGYGGQNIRIDFDNEITVSYLSNGLKLGLGDTARTYIRLLSSVYDIVFKNV